MNKMSLVSKEKQRNELRGNFTNDFHSLNALMPLRLIFNLPTFSYLIYASITWDLIDEEIIMIKTKLYTKLIPCTSKFSFFYRVVTN